MVLGPTCILLHDERGFEQSLCFHGLALLSGEGTSKHFVLLSWKCLVTSSTVISNSPLNSSCASISLTEFAILTKWWAPPTPVLSSWLRAAAKFLMGGSFDAMDFWFSSFCRWARLRSYPLEIRCFALVWHRRPSSKLQCHNPLSWTEVNCQQHNLDSRCAPICLASVLLFEPSC